MSRLPKLPFHMLFDHKENVQAPTTLEHEMASQLGRFGKVVFTNISTVQTYFGKEYGLNMACQNCGRIFLEMPMFGLVVKEERATDGTLYLHCDGVFHAPQCAYEALQRPGVLGKPEYSRSLEWLYAMFPDFTPEKEGTPIGRYRVWTPATNPGFAMLPCRPTHM